MNTALAFVSHDIICAGKRWSTASAYLRPALGRPNLKTEVRCLASRILFDGNRAVGVEYVQEGRKKRVRSVYYFNRQIFVIILLFYVISLPSSFSLI